MNGRKRFRLRLRVELRFRRLYLRARMDGPESLITKFQEAKSVEERLSLSDSIMNEIAPSLYAFILNKAKAVGRIELADDLLQEALIRIFKHLGTFQGRSTRSFWAWCYRLTRNLLIDILRSPRFREAEPLDFEELEKALAASANAEPFGEGDRAELDHALNLLRESKPECVELLWKHYVLEWSHSEVGNLLGLPEDAARMRVKRCLKRARQLVVEKGERV